MSDYYVYIIPLCGVLLVCADQVVPVNSLVNLKLLESADMVGVVKAAETSQVLVVHDIKSVDCHYLSES